MRVLSYGGGINSTAILALVKLGRYPMPDRIIFCDTGAERPETYCYMKFIQKKFPQIETHKRPDTLIEYCQKRRIIPQRQFRWCTDKFKIRVLNKAVGVKEFTRILGIDFGEQHRAKDMACEYPLIDLEVNRMGCIKLIESVGWAVPVKSGCFICPNMKKREIRDMRVNEPEQFKILAELELEAHKRNPNMYLRDDKLVTEYTTDDKEFELDGFEEYQHCLCKFD